MLALAQRDGHVEDESVVMLRALDSLIPRNSLHDFDVMVQARHRSCTAVELVAINGNQVVTANQKDVAVAFGREWLEPRVMVAVRAHELFLGKPFDANDGKLSVDTQRATLGKRKRDDNGDSSHTRVRLR